MTYRQIGNGSAFNYTMTNSSFVIKQQDKYLLFDCGYSVFAELRRLHADIDDDFDLTNLTHVYISHLDDDHIGSLKTLIYYQYFVNNIKLTVLGAEDETFYDLSTFLLDLNEVVILDILTSDKNEWNGLTLITTKTDHHVPCAGLLITDDANPTPSAILVSGDTKATEYLQEVISYCIHSYSKFKLFHDYSNLDDPENQVHACKSDTDSIYGDLVDYLTWYHNDEEFDNSWKDV